MNAAAPAVLRPAPAPSQPARFGVMGLLKEDARTYSTTNGVVILEVLVTQHLQEHPEARHVLARYRYPASADPGAAAADAQRRANEMRAGVEVICTGSALYPGRVHGQEVTVLDDVAAIALANNLF